MRMGRRTAAVEVEAEAETEDMRECRYGWEMKEGYSR